MVGVEREKEGNTIINNATDAVKQVERQKRGMISHDADIASSFPLSIGKLSKLHSPKRTGYGKRGSWGGEMIVVFFLECDEGERCVSSHWAPSWRGHRGFIFFFFRKSHLSAKHRLQLLRKSQIWEIGVAKARGQGD